MIKNSLKKMTSTQTAMNTEASVARASASAFRISSKK